MVEPVPVSRYDGQNIYGADREPLYRLGHYLGGGAAGVVYEATERGKERPVAVKVLNPVGYKLSSGSLQRYQVAVKGEPAAPGEPMQPRHVWWLVHPTTRQAVAAYRDERLGTLRELTLARCVEVWGWGGDDDEEDDDDGHDDDEHGAGVPRVPRKFAKFVAARRAIFREMSNMSQLGEHANVLQLFDVLELVQDSKTTLFLVLELAAGGELFDRIKLDCGTQEETARLFFSQLLAGVGYCHAQGVCHRDLKPENLLLADAEEQTVLKIADFGLSGEFALSGGDGSDSMRRMKSVVGSPHYVAPEVLEGALYDGAKADVWSLGVILYAMLVGNLPFAKDVHRCQRFADFSSWLAAAVADGGPPAWLLPERLSAAAKDVVVALLHPDPEQRPTVVEAAAHEWLVGAGGWLRSGGGPGAGAGAVAEEAEAEEGVEEEEAKVEPEAKLELDLPEPPPTRPPRKLSWSEPNDEGVVARPSSVLAALSLGPSSPPAAAGVGLRRGSAAAAAAAPQESPRITAHSPSRREQGHDIFQSPPLAPLDVDDGALLLDELSLDGGPVSADPPLFTERVKRSTRFLTTVPATEVLSKTEEFLTRRGVAVEVTWEEYKAVAPACTVQVYLWRRGVYMVQFTRRPNVDIFEFKRFYQDCRAELKQMVREDMALQLL